MDRVINQYKIVVPLFVQHDCATPIKGTTILYCFWSDTNVSVTSEVEF